MKEARERYQKLVNTVARDIDCEKERVAEARQVKIEAEIEGEKKQATEKQAAEVGVEVNGSPAELSPVGKEEDDAQTEVLVNGVDRLALDDVGGECPNGLSRELVDKIKSGRKAFQCHSRNVSAASAFSACSLVSQTQSDRDWREIAGDGEEDGMEAVESDMQEGESKEESGHMREMKSNEIEA